MFYKQARVDAERNESQPTTNKSQATNVQKLSGLLSTLNTGNDIKIINIELDLPSTDKIKTIVVSSPTRDSSNPKGPDPKPIVNETPDPASVKFEAADYWQVVEKQPNLSFS